MSAARAPLFGGILHQIQQQALGAIKQPRTDIVAGQLEMRLVNLRAGQAGAGQQVLVYAYGPVNLAALAQQVAQRNVGFQRFAIDLEGVDESVHRAVRAAIQQVVQSLVVLAWHFRRLCTRAAPPQPPTDADGGKQEREYQQVIHRL